MEERTKLQRFGYAVKRLVGVEEQTKIGPMIAYNSGVFLSGGSFYIIGIYFIAFLTQVEGLSTQQAGMVILFAKLSDAFSDPIMGIVTDRTRSKMGRHRPYLLYGLPFAAITYFMMWCSFGISGMNNSTYTMIYYIIAYILFSTAYTVVIVPYTAMLPSLAPEYSLRTQYNAVKTIMDAVGSYSSFIIAGLFFGIFETEEFSPGSRPKFIMMGLILCLWVSIPMLFVFKHCKEPSSLDEVHEPFNMQEFGRQYKTVFKNSSFRRYFALCFFNTAASSFRSNSSYYFLNNIAKMSNRLNVITMVSGVAEAAGFFPAYAMSIKKSKQLPAKVFIPVTIVALLMTFAVNPDSSPILMYAIEFLYGIGLAGMASVTSNIFPDVTDVDMLITGERREGTISTFSTFIKKFISGIMAAMTGFILSGFGFNADSKKAVAESATALFGIRFTYAIVPIALLALSVVSAFRYKMTKQDHALVKRAIAEKQETGEVHLTEDEIKTIESIAGQKFEDMWIGKPANVVAE
ncbi:MAG: MFS transporter [Ruminococcus sp.]|nr:MFS transporter [Ruminococcus sp.]